MENLENNVVNEEVQNNEETKEQAQVKSFTQDEVNEMIAKRVARETKKIEAEKEATIKARLEAERLESEKLAKMSEAERLKAQAEKERKQFEQERKQYVEERKAFEQEKILRLTMEALEDKELPGSFAKFLKVDNADDIMENIDVFAKGFNEAVEKVVSSRMKVATPRVSSGASNYNVDDLKNMTVEQINANWDKIKGLK